MVLFILLSNNGFPFPLQGHPTFLRHLFVGVANAQSCKQVVINTNSTTGKLASPVPRVAQRLDVQADFNMLHFTAVFSQSTSQSLLPNCDYIMDNPSHFSSTAFTS